MRLFRIPLWKKAPFIRLLLPLMTGILLQWYFRIGLLLLLGIGIVCIIFLVSFFLFPFVSRYRFAALTGTTIFFIFFALGALLCRKQDIRNSHQWFGNTYRNADMIRVTLEETLVEKPRSFKAEATVGYLLQDGEWVEVTGRIILYFKKDTLLPPLQYGSQLIITGSLQEIKNAGKLEGFDYKRYCLFKGITHQVFLQKNKFYLLQTKQRNRFTMFLYAARNNVLHVLRQNIRDDKALGLAEALLIGYRDDLDKTLVQSYTNTGVVHIVAISGLHLGLVYGLLVQLLKPLQRNKKWKWFRILLIISGLWLFSLLAGAQPSVLRSALMFTCIILGEGMARHGSVFNTLALSAFILLCINPFWLWDIGFQLSYTAVLSIVIFMKPIYNWFYIKNKLLDTIWKLNAVTLAAQILTTPLSIYHFHQFPNYFLLTNLIAVPLSSLIVLGEIFLCAITWFPLLSILTGKLLVLMIGFMNTWIERIEWLPYSLLKGLQITALQTISLFIAIAGVSYWLMEKSKR